MFKEKVVGNFGELSYKIHPGGDKVLLAFHGFGQDCDALFPIIEEVKHEYTVYAFNNFFHGSIWKFKEKPLTQSIWKQILETLIAKHNIDKFDLVGFSMGAKISLSTFELFPKKVNKIYLLAPDGIQTNVWYNLATYPIIFRRYFKSMIVQPSRFYSILSGLQRFGMVSNGLMRFASSQMNTASKRHRVYYSWVVYKELKASREALIQLINDHGCEVQFYLGKYDKVIPQKGIKVFAEQLTKKSLTILDCGHNALITEVAMELPN